MTHHLHVYTDGSGHINGYGGWAALIMTPDGYLTHFKMGAASGTSVDRMEFTALLEGLQGAWEVAQAMPESHVPGWRPQVLWFSDRENLVHSVQRLNARSNCPDLWPRFEWYEKLMTIEARFVTEAVFKTSREFQEVDIQSSIGYQMMKFYDTDRPAFSNSIQHDYS